MCGCGCACGHKNWCVGACATYCQNVCHVRAGAAENPRTLKVCINPTENFIPLILDAF
jgi:hypothetical protein